MAEKQDLAALRKKMQAAQTKICKDLNVKPVGFEPPEGTNGACSTGVLTVDLISGGGFPKNRLSVVSGESTAGKTTLCTKALGIALQKGTIGHHIDLEGAADYTWMLRNGTDMNKFLGDKRGDARSLWYIPDFESGDDAFRYMNRILEEAIKLGASEYDQTVNFILHDSLPASVPESLIEHDEAGSSPHLALLLSKWLPAIRMRLKKANTVYVAVNQLRVNPRAKFGSPIYEPGGNTPQFVADMKLFLTRTGKAKLVGNPAKPHPIAPSDAKMFKEGGVSLEENPDGTIDKYFYTKVQTKKNRVFPPLKETFFRTWIEENGETGRGIDPVFDTIRFFEEIGKCQFNSKDEVVLKGQVYSYFDLKQEILSKPDLRQEAEDLLNSGKAFDLYFQRLSGAGQSVGEPDGENSEGEAA
jgi:RecA/RadA recombinase